MNTLFDYNSSHRNSIIGTLLRKKYFDVAIVLLNFYII